MNRRAFLKSFSIATGGLAFLPNCTFRRGTKKLPNIVLILADDLGYGDVHALNPQSKIPTPNLDALANEGIVFTDAHSNSAVCTPTRYGILTGRYAWRSRLQSGVLAGYAPPLIPKNRLTLAGLLNKAGYVSACVGKWHLGLQWGTKDGYRYDDDWNASGEHVDFTAPVKGGPRQVGFDYFYGIASSLDIPPYVYIENETALGTPVGWTKGQDGYGFFRPGPMGQGFDHGKVLSQLTTKCLSFMEEQTRTGQNPFFLYYAMTAPHTPILPEKAFEGRSGLGPYGDFVVQVDDAVGKILTKLRELKIDRETLVIFTSDNGPSPAANFLHLNHLGHFPSYIYRGAKADIYEGGHRIPLLARWTGKIPAKSQYDHPVCLTDFMATFAQLIGDKLPPNAGEDSVSFLPALLGKTKQPLRADLIHHSINGSFSIRQGKWKLELCPSSGGWSAPTPQQAFEMRLPMLQLYDLSFDLKEQHNLQDQYPEVVHRLLNLLEKQVDFGRSTSGPRQSNDVQPDIWKYLQKRKTEKFGKEEQAD